MYAKGIHSKASSPTYDARCPHWTFAQKHGKDMLEDPLNAVNEKCQVYPSEKINYALVWPKHGLFFLIQVHETGSSKKFFLRQNILEFFLWDSLAYALSKQKSDPFSDLAAWKMGEYLLDFNFFPGGLELPDELLILIFY